MNKKNVAFYLIFFLILACAIFLRFYELDMRVFHHDEAAVGYFTYKLFSEKSYAYDPAFHGPFMYYATTEIFKRFGDTEYFARLLPAVLGSIMMFFLLPLKKYIGKCGILISAFFFAFSPSFLYYSRFYREDIFMSFFSLLLLVCSIKLYENRSCKNITIKRQYLFFSILILAAAGFIWLIHGFFFQIISFLSLRGINLLSIAMIASVIIVLIYSGYPVPRLFYIITGALSMASLVALKENAYIIMALILSFLFLIVIREKWYTNLTGKIRSLDNELLIVITEISFVVFLFLVFSSIYYTLNFLDISGMKEAFIKAVSHWYEMHKIERMAGPFYFYLPLLALYELPILVFGVLGIVHYGCCEKKKEKMLTMLIIYWLILDIMYYIKNVYPDSGKFLPISYIPDSIIIFLPLLFFAILTVLRSNNRLASFLIYWALSNFLVYSYVQEKVPWLILNPLLPLTLIAAMYMSQILRKPDMKSRSGAIVTGFIIVSSLFFIYSSIQLNFNHYTYPGEPLIQAAQPPQKYSLFLAKINEVSSQYDGNSTIIQLADAELETQFLWYMRHFNNVRWKVSLNSSFDAPLIVAHDGDGNDSDAEIIRQKLPTDYERLNSAKMSWYWFQPSDITLDYLLYRKMDREPSEYRIVLYYRPKNPEII